MNDSLCRTPMQNVFASDGFPGDCKRYALFPIVSGECPSIDFPSFAPDPLNDVQKLRNQQNTSRSVKIGFQFKPELRDWN